MVQSIRRIIARKAKMKYNPKHWRYQVVVTSNNGQQNVVDNADGELNYSFAKAYEDLLLIYFCDWSLYSWTHWITGFRMAVPLYEVRIDFWVNGGDCVVVFNDDLLINNYKSLSKTWVLETLQIKESELDLVFELRKKFIRKIKGEEFARNFNMSSSLPENML